MLTPALICNHNVNNLLSIHLILALPGTTYILHCVIYTSMLGTQLLHLQGLNGSCWHSHHLSLSIRHLIPGWLRALLGTQEHQSAQAF